MHQLYIHVYVHRFAMALARPAIVSLIINTAQINTTDAIHMLYKHRQQSIHIVTTWRLCPSPCCGRSLAILPKSSPTLP